MAPSCIRGLLQENATTSCKETFELIVPAGSSKTAAAFRYTFVRRFGGRSLISATTRLSLSRKTASIGNFIQKVCMPLQGRIRSPSPASSRFFPRRPFIRAGKLSAKVILFPSSIPLFFIVAFTEKILFYIGMMLRGISLLETARSDQDGRNANTVQLRTRSQITCHCRYLVADLLLPKKVGAHLMSKRCAPTSKARQATTFCTIWHK